MYKNVIIVLLGSIVVMSELVNHSLEKQIKTKDDIIQNQQQTVMELVADKVKNQLTQEDEDIKRLIKDLR